MTSATILKIRGDQDGIRHGRALWPDGFQCSFQYDRLAGGILLISYSAVEAYTDITDSHRDRLPAIEEALHAHPQAGPPVEPSPCRGRA